MESSSSSPLSVVMYPAILQSDSPSEVDQNLYIDAHVQQEIEIKLPRWDLPTKSKLEPEKSYCGEFFNRGAACPTEGHFEGSFKPYVSHCNNPKCPVCTDPWSHRGAVASSERVWGIREAYVQEGCNLGLMSHIIFSPPQGQVYDVSTLKAYHERRDELNALLKKIGSKGGVLLFHPCRFRHEDGSLCDDKLQCTEKHFSYDSPHWHLLGAGWLMNSRKFKAMTWGIDVSMEDWEKTFELWRREVKAGTRKEGGWIYKKIRLNTQLQTEYQRVLAYLLTHCGLVYRTGQYDHRAAYALTYPGLFNYAKVGVKYTPDKQYEHCEICDKVLQVCVVDEDLKLDYWEDGDCCHIVVIRSFYLRKKWLKQMEVSDYG